MTMEHPGASPGSAVAFDATTSTTCESSVQMAASVMASSVARMSLERSGALVWYRVQPLGSLDTRGMMNWMVRRTASVKCAFTSPFASIMASVTAWRHGFTFFEASTRRPTVRPLRTNVPLKDFEPCGAGTP